MKHPPLDDGTADRLLSGSVAPDDAPAGYAEVARLVRVARGPAAVTEVLPLVPADPFVGTGTVISMSAARNRRLATRVAAAAAVVVVLSGTAAAAASGSLPGPAQDALSRAGRAVGLDIPRDHKPDKDKAGEQSATTTVTTGSPATSGSTTTVATGPSLPGPALVGLCNAYGKGEGGDQGAKLDSSAFEALEKAAGVVEGDDAAGAAAKVATYCAAELAKLGLGKPDTTSTSQGKPDDPGKPPVTTGKPSTRPTPPVSTGKPSTPPTPPVSAGMPTDAGKPAGAGTTTTNRP